MENENKASDCEEMDPIAVSVDEFYDAIKEEAENDNRVSVIHDYLDMLEQKKADTIIGDDNCIQKFRKIQGEKNNKQLLIRVGYGLVKRGLLRQLDFLQTLFEILDKDQKSSLFVDDDINTLLECLEIRSRSKTRKKAIRQVSDALYEDGAEGLLEKNRYNGIDRLVRSMTDSIMKYQIDDFFRDRERNADSRKGIDPVYLYRKYCVRNNIITQDESILPKISRALSICKKLGPRTDSDLLIPVVVDRSMMCGIFIAGRSFFTSAYVPPELRNMKVYAGLNIMRLEDVSSKWKDDGVSCVLEPWYQTIYSAYAVDDIGQIEDDFEDCLNSYRADIVKKYGQLMSRFSDSGMELFSNTVDDEEQECLNQSERELSAREGL